MIYATVSVTITNPDSMAKYREKAGDALKKHNATVVAVSPELTVLEGSPELPNVAVILGFENRDAALGWINDPDLAAVHALRQGAGKSEIILLG